MLRLAFLVVTVQAGAVDIIRGPYLEGVTADAAFVCVRTDVSSLPRIEFQKVVGRAPRREVVAEGPGRDHCLRLDGLETGKTYEYRLAASEPGKPPGWGQRHRFTAAEPSGAPVRFAVVGDTGNGTAAQSAVARRLAEAEPAFVVHLGDVVYPHGEDEDYDRRFFEPYAPLLGRTPFYLTPGNHDYANHRFRTEKGARHLRDNFLSIHRFPAPRPRLPPPPDGASYYSFDRGGVHFAAVDANRVYPIPGAPALDPGSAQWDWLDADLAASTAPWKVVFMHIPLYSSGRHGSNETLIRWLEPLFERRGVDVVFQGHDHDYERTWPLRGGERSEEGVVYVTAGTGGATSTSRRSQGAWSAFFLRMYGFVEVRVETGRLSVRAIDAEGRTVDSWERSK